MSGDLSPLLDSFCACYVYRHWISAHVQNISFAATHLHTLLGTLAKISKSDYYLRHVGLSVHMEQLGSHRTDFLKFDISLLF
jgi:hypothetical protein